MASTKTAKTTAPKAKKTTAPKEVETNVVPMVPAKAEAPKEVVETNTAEVAPKSVTTSAPEVTDAPVVMGPFPATKAEMRRMECHANFKRLATARVNGILNEFRKVGNLASANYYHEPEDAEKILKALEAGMADIREKLMAPKSEKKEGLFSL